MNVKQAREEAACVASQVEITWIEFVNFLREIINSIKQRVTRVDEILLDLRQHSRQSIIQLIAYLKTLKEQWIDFIQNFVQALFLTQILHLYIRRELTRRQIDTISRREMKKTTRDIKIIELVSIHLKKKNDNSHKTSEFESKRRCIQNNTLSKNVLIVALVASVALSRFTDNKRFNQSRKLVSRKKNSQQDREFKSATSRDLIFAYYNCDSLNHFKNKCRQSIRERKASSH